MIALGADHGGYKIKEAVKAYLQQQGIPYKDFGTDSEESVDYAIFAPGWPTAWHRANAKKGVLCCGTGIGISMAANKVKGIRAAVCTNEYCAEMTRRHNDANILAMGGRVIDEKTAVKLADIFLHTPFEGGRHARRIAQIAALENGGSTGISELFRKRRQHHHAVQRKCLCDGSSAH